MFLCYSSDEIKEEKKDQCNNQRKTIMIRFELLSNGNGLRSCKSKEFSTVWKVCLVRYKCSFVNDRYRSSAERTVSSKENEIDRCIFFFSKVTM